MEKALVDCVNCGKGMPATRPDQMNHGIHAFMSFFTCGLWIPVWLWKIAKAPESDWRCKKCGEIVEVPLTFGEKLMGIFMFFFVCFIIGIVAMFFMV